MDPNHVFAAIFEANQANNDDQNNVVMNDNNIICRMELENYKGHMPPAVTKDNLKVLYWWKDHINNFLTLQILLKNTYGFKQHLLPLNMFSVKVVTSSAKCRLDLVKIQLARDYMLHQIMRGISCISNIM